MSYKPKAPDPHSDRTHVVEQSESSVYPAFDFVRTFVQANSSDVKVFGEGLASIQIGHQSVEQAITGFAESTKIGIQVMDELSKLHPFIAGPVLAFKLIINLDMKRRDNDKKVAAMKVQIQDLICVLTDIYHISKSMPDEYAKASGRLQELAGLIEQDIRRCGSDCEVYVNKSVLRKFIKSPIYEARFSEHARHFITHRNALQSILTTHTAGRAEDTNRKLDSQRIQLIDIQDQIKELFKRLDTPKEKVIRKIIEDAGGAGACLSNDFVLRELVVKSEDESFREGLEKDVNLQIVRDNLQQELFEDLDKLFQQNFVMFEVKLGMQEKQIQDSITKLGDQIASKFSCGYERVNDPHMKAIWQEMDWKGNIKAVDFMFALRDYFSSLSQGSKNSFAQRLADNVETKSESSPHTSDNAHDVTKPMPQTGDEWIKLYIDASHIQPILEAIDDDGSGYINIQEVNCFTSNCPNGWSIQQWLAYWASGWHRSISIYKEKIYRLLKKMSKLLYKARSENRVLLDNYLDANCIMRLETLLRSTKEPVGYNEDLELTKLVNIMMEQEESRLKKNLDHIQYNIDAATVNLVCESGSIDKHIYPLLYLLLNNHVEIFQLSRTGILDTYELERCSDSIVAVFEVFDIRCDELKATFEHMHVNSDSQFEIFLFGMFRSSLKRDDWDISENKLQSVWEELYMGAVDEDIENCPQNLDTTILKKGFREPFLLPPAEEYDMIGPMLGPMKQFTAYPSNPFGRWTGFCNGEYIDMRPFSMGPFILDIKESANDSDHIKGNVEYQRFLLNLSGHYTDLETEGFMVEIVIGSSFGDFVRCHGKMSSDFASITGGWEPSPGHPIRLHGSSGKFSFTRATAEAKRFIYADNAFQENPKRARWNFAREAVMYDVQRRMMKKSFVLTRIHQMVLYKNLMLKSSLEWMSYSLKSELSDQERMELEDIKKNLPQSIQQFLDSVVTFIISRLPSHGIYYCDNCEEYTKPTRITCITCKASSLVYGIDLCLGCSNTDNTFPFEDITIHNKSHSVIRGDFRMHGFQLAWMLPKAREISERIKKYFRSIEETALKKENVDKVDIPTSLVAVESSSEELEEIGIKTRRVPEENMKCSVCQKPILLPFFVDLECDVDTFICDICDEARLLPPFPHKMYPSPYSVQHILLRINDSKDVPGIERDRMVRVEKALGVVKLDLDNRLCQLESRVKERTNVLEMKLDDHLNALKQDGGSLSNIEVLEAVDGIARNFGDRFEVLEQRMAAIESKFLNTERILMDIASMLQGKTNSST
ncbi:hypothetical protein BDQ17DRAFT_1327703 [Cyathus striatus]|nr:hypothetical protein BDQ17DRAFT_1327703 [Cyathus striatus]